MEKDLISVIVPVYNMEEYIKQCLDSILNQTYTNLEIIVVDDGSNDGSEKICDDYKNKDSRITVIHQKNSGVSVARNVGLDFCKGKFISFVDPDDYVEPQYIEYLYNSLIENCVDISLCDYNYVDKNSKITGNEKWDNIDIIHGKELLKENRKLINSVVWNKLYSRDIWKNLRFPVR